MIYNELKQHGREDFPFALYKMTSLHPKYEMAFHWHSALEFIRVLEGELELTLDNQPYVLKSGEVALVNSETVHGATPRDCTYECIVFNLSFLKTNNRACDGFIDDLLTRNTLLCERPQDRGVVELVHEIFEEMRLDCEGSSFSVIGLFHKLLGEIQKKKLYVSHLQAASENEKKVVKLKIVLKYMRDNFASDMTLDDMSAVAGLSCKYFCKFFKKMTGTTPVNYLMAYRVERAARKLLNSDLSVTQIAFDCGFNDLSYFIKTFKSFKGVSPTDYRKL